LGRQSGKPRPLEKASARGSGVYQIAGVIRAEVIVASGDGEFKLQFLVGANDEIAAWGPKGSMRCFLTADSIESPIRDEIQRELNLRPFKGAI
jgi:hypothetical protein